MTKYVVTLKYRWLFPDAFMDTYVAPDGVGMVIRRHAWSTGDALTEVMALVPADSQEDALRVVLQVVAGMTDKAPDSTRVRVAPTPLSEVNR